MKTRMFKTIAIFIVVYFFTISIALGTERFPKPEFDSNYSIPSPEFPHSAPDILEFLDIIVLAAALALASYFALWKRTRWGHYFIACFSVIYFGFYREGCVCSIGSIQNMILSFFDQTYILPVTVILLFILPLIFSLFFGRVFCSGVCPLGAIQELVIFKHLRVPEWVNKSFGIFPYLYLGLAVLYASNGSRFIICQYDPFVSVYRLSGPFWLLLAGAFFLILGVFIARPYCRFICPYGVLLSWMSFFSKRHISITADECIQCRLCETSCPVDAIDKPTPEKYLSNKNEQIKKMIIAACILPFFIFLTGFGFSKLSSVLARGDSTVALAEQIYEEEKGDVPRETLDSKAYRGRGEPIKDLYEKADLIRNSYITGSWILGIFMGLVIGIKALSLFIRRSRIDYTPNKMACVSCGRCMEYSPVKEER